MKNIFKFLALIIPFSINAQVDFINTSNSGDGSSALGYHTTASGSFSTAMGAYTTASGYASISMGEQTIASGYYSTAMGEQTIASGYYSTAMGSYTIASGSNSTALGNSNYATGSQSTAMGIGTVASGLGATSIGWNTNAVGIRSTALGYRTEALGINSTSTGYLTSAVGNVSTSMGDQTTASGYAGFSIGVLNFSGYADNNPTDFDLTNTAFVIGNGTAEENRSDAFTVLFDGTTTIAGDLSVNSDARLKTNIISLGSTLAKLLQIDGKSYTMKKDENKKQKIGVLAQDIEKVFPELVSESNGIKSVNYQGLVPVLINALKEQQSEIETYRNEVSELKEMVEKLALRD